MRTSPFLTVVIVSLLALACLGAQPFEGTRWKVLVTPDEEARAAGEKEFSDVLVFKGGKFTAEACAKYGFKPVEYDENTAPGGIAATFTAEPESEEEGKAKWRGTATGAEMRGELTWEKPDGTTVNYTFRGERMAR